MDRKVRFAALWIVIGGLLFLVGSDLYSLIPEFDLKNIMLSVRIQLLIIYALVAGYIWVRGWKDGLTGQLPRSRFFTFLQSTIIRFPIWIRRIAAAVIAALPVFLLLFNPLGYEPVGFWVKAFILFAAAFGVNLFLHPGLATAEWPYKYFYSLVVVAVLLFAGGFFSKVTSYPFSLTWSEGNRIWDYSLIFGGDRYLVAEGHRLSGFISAGRQFLWGLPFLIPGIDIFGLRLWDAFLKVVPYFILGSLLFANHKES
ncbi:MAG: hypothetical protein N2D54_08180, partial [Chloroflexota bacterium]